VSSTFSAPASTCRFWRSGPAWSWSRLRNHDGKRRGSSCRLLNLGQRSYEVYLAALGLFSLFLAAGKPLAWVPGLLIATILLAAVLGEVVARCYSEPMNRWLRKKWNDDPERRATFAITSEVGTN
jgi:peptidoglycan/LPS O-acetylase OafA/YrhL